MQNSDLEFEFTLKVAFTLYFLILRSRNCPGIC